MSAYEANPTFGQNAIIGSIPGLFVGVDTPDGDRWPWLEAPVGSEYVYKASETLPPVIYRKLKNDSRDDDWVVATGGLGVLTAYFTSAMMTDGGSTVGTYAVPTQTIPQGAYVYRSVLENVTGFTGDTSATIQIGDGTDVDRYSTGTPSVFTTANAIDVGAVSGTAIHTAAKNVTVTITSGADFTSVAAGAATLRIYYFK